MSSNSKVPKKRKKIANSRSVEESSSEDPTTNEGKTRDQIVRSKSMSPRRNCWREKIKSMKGWRDELNDRKKSKDLGQKQSKLCDRVNKMCSRSRFSRSRNFQRYERLPMRPKSKTSLLKDLSVKQDKERKKAGKPARVRSTLANREEMARVSKVQESSGIEVEVDGSGGKGKVVCSGNLEADKKKADTIDEKVTNKSFTLKDKTDSVYSQNLSSKDDQESSHNQRVEHLAVEIMFREDGTKIKPAAVDRKLCKNQQDDRNDATIEKEVNNAVHERELQSGQIGSQAAHYDCCLMLNQNKDGLDTSPPVVNTELL